MTSLRFYSTSQAIDITRLERESRKYLYLGLVVGVLMHLAAAPFITYSGFEEAQRETQDIRRMKTELVVLPPATANPYEDWEKELTPRPYIRKEFRPVQPSASIPFTEPSTEVTSHSDAKILNARDAVRDVIRMLATAEDSLFKIYPYTIDVLSSPDLAISSEPDDHVSLIDELIDFDDIDALGEYKAFVVRDLSDKKNLRGFFHIPQHVTEMHLLRKGNPAKTYNLVYAIDGLSEAFNFYTGLKLTVDEPISLGSDALLEYPVIYLTTEVRQAFEISDKQTELLREFFDRGGFAILDTGRPWNIWCQASASLLGVLSKAFGDSIRFERLPRDHPVYYCFFEFDSITPKGGEEFSEDESIEWGQPTDIPDWGRLLRDPVLDRLRHQVIATPASLWGVWRGERLMAIYSDKGYGHLWQRGIIANKSRDFYSHSAEKYNFNPQLKLGVNMLVYALLQERGIAHRLTDYSMR